MKKGFYLFLLLMFTLILCGCAKKFEVKFVNGDAVTTISVKEGEKVENISPGTYQDHIFAGWYENEELFDFDKPITNDTTLNAKWDLIQYKITFKRDDGSILKEEMVNINEKIIAPSDVSKESDDDYDYTFSSWDKEFDTATSDLVITANYTKSIKKYNVTFYDEDKKEITTLEIEKGSTCQSLNIKKDDDDMYSYELSGWTLKNGELFDFNSKIEADVNLYPKFKRIPLYTNLSGKVVSLMGDSVSTFYKDGDKNNSYYSGDNEFYYPRYCSAINESAKTWWMLTINGIGAKLGVNNSLSGSSVSGSSSKAGQSYERVRTLGSKGSPNIVICYLGINDNVNGVTNTQFKQAYKTMLDRIIETYPKAYIFVCTHAYSGYYKQASHYYYEETDRLAYNQILRDLAEEYQIGLIEFDKAITEDNYSTNFNDNLHYNVKGMNTMSKQAILDINRYFNQKRTLYAIDFVLDSDDISMTSELYSYYQDENITLPSAKKTGYTFKGWYQDPDFEGDRVLSTKGFNEDLVLYPRFVPIMNAGEFYIEYRLNGGRLVNVDINATEAEFCADYQTFASTFFAKEITISDISDLGFVKYDDGTWGFPKKADGSTDWGKLYYAQSGSGSGYAIAKFFKDNDAKWGWLLKYIAACAINNSSLMTTETTWPEPIVIELCAFFHQEQIQASGIHNTAPYGDDTQELNADIYDYYPSVSPIQSGTYTLPSPTRDGYTFKGWYTNKDFEGEAITEVSSDTRVYAKWE